MSTETTPISTMQPQVGASGRSTTKGINIERLIIFCILFIGAIIMILPFAFLISSSLKIETQVFQFPIQWIPNPVRWLNYCGRPDTKTIHQVFF